MLSRRFVLLAPFLFGASLLLTTHSRGEQLPLDGRIQSAEFRSLLERYQDGEPLAQLLETKFKNGNVLSGVAKTFAAIPEDPKHIKLRISRPTDQYSEEKSVFAFHNFELLDLHGFTIRTSGFGKLRLENKQLFLEVLVISLTDSIGRPLYDKIPIGYLQGNTIKLDRDYSFSAVTVETKSHFERFFRFDKNDAPFGYWTPVFIFNSKRERFFSPLNELNSQLQTLLLNVQTSGRNGQEVFGSDLSKEDLTLITKGLTYENEALESTTLQILSQINGPVSLAKETWQKLAHTEFKKAAAATTTTLELDVRDREGDIHTYYLQKPRQVLSLDTAINFMKSAGSEILVKQNEWGSASAALGDLPRMLGEGIDYYVEGAIRSSSTRTTDYLADRIIELAELLRHDFSIQKSFGSVMARDTSGALEKIRYLKSALRAEIASESPFQRVIRRIGSDRDPARQRQALLEALSFLWELGSSL